MGRLDFFPLHKKWYLTSQSENNYSFVLTSFFPVLGKTVKEKYVAQILKCSVPFLIRIWELMLTYISSLSINRLLNQKQKSKRCVLFFSLRKQIWATATVCNYGWGFSGMFVCAWTEVFQIKEKNRVLCAFCMCVSAKRRCPTTQSVGPITPCQKHTACIVGLQGGSHSTVRSYQVTLPRHAYYSKGKKSQCVS